MTDVSFAKLTSMHFYGWKKGLKTGMYYLRSQAAADAIKFTVDAQLLRTGSAETANTPAESKQSPPKAGVPTTPRGSVVDAKGLDVKTPSTPVSAKPLNGNGSAAAG